MAKLSALFALFLSLPVIGSLQAQSPVDSVTTTLREILSSASHSDIRWSRFPDRKSDLKRFYGDTGTVSVASLPLQWIQNGQPTKQALAVIAELQTVDEFGLNPGDYDASTLDSIAKAFVQDASQGNKPNAVSIAKFDAALSVAIMRLASDLRMGRVNPKQFKFNFSAGNKLLDLAGFVRMIQLGEAPERALRALEPPFLRYGLLKTALAKYRAVPDSIADSTHKQNIRRIILTLERWRWIPHDLGSRFIAVNIPAFELYAFDLNISRDQAQLTMPVVVGAAFKHETPVFGGRLQFLVFRPYWNIPSGILRNETLPKLRRNPGSLASDRLEIVAANAPDAPTTTYPATSANLSRLASGNFRVRQRPGPKNALGLVKFMFPNAYDVYLHDTPTQSAFEKNRRDLSHGCVRVANPAALAEFVLKGQGSWGKSSIDSAMQSGTDSRRINVAEPINVFILYGTAFADADGSVNFYADIYKYDAQLEKALAKGYPYQ